MFKGSFGHIKQNLSFHLCFHTQITYFFNQEMLYNSFMAIKLDFLIIFLYIFFNFLIYFRGQLLAIYLHFIMTSTSHEMHMPTLDSQYSLYVCRIIGANNLFLKFHYQGYIIEHFSKRSRVTRCHQTDSQSKTLAGPNFLLHPQKASWQLDYIRK